MIYLLFGLPGTGKSTYARSQDRYITLDMGIPRDDDYGEKIWKKTVYTATSILSMEGLREDVFIDSFPMYFKSIVPEMDRRFYRVVFAIPQESLWEEVFTKVRDRGDTDDFVTEYRKFITSWLPGWENTLLWWQEQGFNVTRVDTYWPNALGTNYKGTK